MCVLCVLHLLFSVLDAAAREDCILAWITFYRVGSPMNEISIDHTSVRWGLRSTKGFTISQMVDKIVKNCFYQDLRCRCSGNQNGFFYIGKMLQY